MHTYTVSHSLKVTAVFVFIPNHILDCFERLVKLLRQLAVSMPSSIRLRFIRKTHCQRDFMLWRGSARLGGVGGVDFNKIGRASCRERV